MLLLVSPSLWAQQIPAIPIPAANAVHPHEFSGITSLRELSDGRVIVTDGREQRLLVLDFRTGTSREIGRTGRGPNEYSMVAQVFAVGGDSSIMVDYFQRRWLLFHRDSIVVTVPPDDAAVQAAKALISGADGLGRVLLRKDAPVRDGTTFTTERDSGAIVLISRRTGRADTVTRVRLAPRRLTQQTNAEGRITQSSTMVTQLLPAEEDYELFPDGALAVARLDPFRVDWRLPDGRWIRGDSIPVRKIAVDARERRAYEARNSGPRPQVPAGFEAPPAEYPRFVPPFPIGQGVMAGPRGLLLVRRTKSADFPTMTYLLIDRTGKAIGTFTLSNRESVVGASATALYVTESDEDDLIRLRRHPWR
jgi:hypothetical protein